MNTVRKHRGQPELDAIDFLALLDEKAKLVEMEEALLNRSVNEGFSGGEKKRNEVLQMAILDPKLAILDETDSGLDIDALRIAAAGVNALRDGARGMLVITHYQRLLDYIVPDFVHVLSDGRIVKSGDKELAKELEAKGYSWIEKGAAGDGLASREPAHDDASRAGRRAPRRSRRARGARDGARGPAAEPAVAAEAAPGGVSAFERLGFPSTNDEEWRFTNLAPLRPDARSRSPPTRSPSPSGRRRSSWRRASVRSGCRRPSRGSLS